MVTSVRFLQKFCCFEPGDTFEFRPGVNLLVGDQGCGKSSLMNAIRLSDRKNPVVEVVLGQRGAKVFAFDFERDNPRMRSMSSEGDLSYQMKAAWGSHGESVKSILSGLLPAVQGQLRKHPDLTPLVLLDEPDIGLSIRSCYRVIGVLLKLEALGAQILCAVHNPTVIEAFPQVLSLEDREWLASEVFIERQRRHEL